MVLHCRRRKAGNYPASYRRNGIAAVPERSSERRNAKAKNVVEGPLSQYCFVYTVLANQKGKTLPPQKPPKPPKRKPGASPASSRSGSRRRGAQPSNQNAFKHGFYSSGEWVFGPPSFLKRLMYLNTCHLKPGTIAPYQLNTSSSPGQPLLQLPAR
jgi:hypothetical protein